MQVTHSSAQICFDSSMYYVYSLFKFLRVRATANFIKPEGYLVKDRKFCWCRKVWNRKFYSLIHPFLCRIVWFIGRSLKLHKDPFLHAEQNHCHQHLAPQSLFDRTQELRSRFHTVLHRKDIQYCFYAQHSAIELKSFVLSACSEALTLHLALLSIDP